MDNSTMWTSIPDLSVAGLAGIRPSEHPPCRHDFHLARILASSESSPKTGTGTCTTHSQAPVPPHIHSSFSTRSHRCSTCSTNNHSQVTAAQQRHRPLLLHRPHHCTWISNDRHPAAILRHLRQAEVCLELPTTVKQPLLQRPPSCLHPPSLHSATKLVSCEEKYLGIEGDSKVLNQVDLRLNEKKLVDEEVRAIEVDKIDDDDGLHDSSKIATFDFDGCLAKTSVK
ncbi:hypothetical protein SASPL_132015 [Salvia splendens]|uniref:Uncharacterized protein n=1 Tax=Salvia splendens TaxID=180675 RepID=A0A8X8ZL56_SALSN|nr:hypothetical protein SASPL_132015 [Salvia splendens]